MNPRQLIMIKRFTAMSLKSKGVSFITYILAIFGVFKVPSKSLRKCMTDVTLNIAIFSIFGRKIKSKEKKRKVEEETEVKERKGR